MTGGVLPADDEERLVGELRDVLDEVLRTSGCLDMHPLWLIATKKPRAEFLRPEGTVVSVPPHIMRWKAPKRTKWSSLAHWRHVVLWKETLAELPAALAKALRDAYFTPFEANAVPYAWTQRSSGAPAAGSYDSPNAMDRMVKEACAESLRILLEPGSEARTMDEIARAAFADLRPRLGSIYDILRVE